MTVRIATLLCLALVLTSAKADESATNEMPWKTTAISFLSADGTELAGSFVTARKVPPFAAVVLASGSDGKRYENLAALMALRGIATLTYDKRGVGESGGERGHSNDVSAANLDLLASDAAAAMKWLAQNSEARSIPRGYVGVSQSGWVIPLALAQSPEVWFIGFWSGPTCTTSAQLHFQGLSEAHGYDRSAISDADIREAMSHVQRRSDDVDPLTPLKKISVPGLWLFGAKDPYLPIEVSVRRLKTLIKGGKSNFSYQIFPGEAHNLADSSDQVSFTAMISWIKQISSKP
ncbi:MAG: hypothetical protein NVS9B4_23380 [Candidatus Acidiferrum sp.]